MAKKKEEAVEEKTFDWQAHLDEFKDHISQDLWPLVKPMEWFILNPVNSLTHTDEDVLITMGSLKEFGQRVTVFYNKITMKVLAGNGRYMAATKLGWKYMAFAGEKDDIMTETRWQIADNLTGRAAKFDLTNVSEMVRTMGDKGRTIPGMTEEIFEDWTEDDPAGTEDEPPEYWQEFDEKIGTNMTCPKCGYEF